MGSLTTDKRDLLILIEKKERNYNGYYMNGNGQLPESDQARNRPLFGAEDSGPPQFYLAGTIVDDETGQPVKEVKITPGRKPPSTSATASGGGLLQAVIEAVRPRTIPWNERIYWEMGRVVTTTDGHFSIPNRELKSLPLLRFEADGYRVFETPPADASNTNLVVRLKKGVGPKGVLKQPDGQPAADVTVIFAGEQEQFGLNQAGDLQTYGVNRNVVKTKADGSFSLPNRADGRRVFAGHASGWAEVDANQWPNDGEVKLVPWGRLSGTLLNTDGKPATKIRLMLQLGSRQDGDPWINFQEQPETDADGRFAFRIVPPGNVSLVRLVPMSANSWTHAPQTNVVVKAGTSVDLGTMTMKTSPVPGFQ
jgi:5-hydroxyisourate hydrolase-like protein (transthyretin family)